MTIFQFTSSRENSSFSIGYYSYRTSLLCSFLAALPDPSTPSVSIFPPLVPQPRSSFLEAGRFFPPVSSAPLFFFHLFPSPGRFRLPPLQPPPLRRHGAPSSSVSSPFLFHPARFLALLRSTLRSLSSSPSRSLFIRRTNERTNPFFLFTPVLVIFFPRPPSDAGRRRPFAIGTLSRLSARPPTPTYGIEKERERIAKGVSKREERVAAAPGCELKCIFFPFFIFPSSCSWVGWITNPGIVEHVFPFFPSFSPFPSSLVSLSSRPPSSSFFSPGRKGCIGRRNLPHPHPLRPTPSCFRLDGNYRVEFLKGLCFVSTKNVAWKRGCGSSWRVIVDISINELASCFSDGMERPRVEKFYWVSDFGF